MKNWKNQIETLKLATEQERNRESHFFTTYTTMLDSFCAATEIIPDLASVHKPERGDFCDEEKLAAPISLTYQIGVHTLALEKTFFKNTIILFFVSLKFCISIVFNFSWD